MLGNAERSVFSDLKAFRLQLFECSFIVGFLLL